MARPSTFRERAGKWTRRHPAGAGLFVVSTVAVVGFMALILFQSQRLQSERNFAQQQEQRAITAAGRAEASERTADERAYAADFYAASQALSAGDLAQARRPLGQ